MVYNTILYERFCEAEILNDMVITGLDCILYISLGISLFNLILL